MRDQDLGADMEQVMVVEGPSLTSFDSTFIARIASFKNEAQAKSQCVGSRYFVSPFWRSVTQGLQCHT